MGTLSEMLPKQRSVVDALLPDIEERMRNLISAPNVDEATAALSDAKAKAKAEIARHREELANAQKDATDRAAEAMKRAREAREREKAAANDAALQKIEQQKAAVKNLEAELAAAKAEKAGEVARERAARDEARGEANRLRAIATLRMQIADWAINNYDKKMADVVLHDRQQVSYAKAGADFEKRQRVLAKAEAAHPRKLREARSRADKAKVNRELVMQQNLFDAASKRFGHAKSEALRDTPPGPTNLDGLRRNRAKAYKKLHTLLDGTADQKGGRDNAIGRVRGWIALMLEQDAPGGPTRSNPLDDAPNVKGQFYNLVVDPESHRLRDDMQPFAEALEEQVLNQKDVFLGGGAYDLRATGESWTRGASFGDLTRGLWLLDPLIPMPGVEMQDNWTVWPPLFSAGHVDSQSSPKGVSVWTWNPAVGKWEIEGSPPPS